MRKYLLLAGAALIGLGGSAYAAIDCAVPPTCDELGYVMNPDECLTDDVLTCPFDDGKVFRQSLLFSQRTALACNEL